jgi:hypothetical protein
MKKILVSGCSHVFGDGLTDFYENRFQPSKFTWASITSQTYKNSIEVVNISRPGNSPSMLIRDILKYISTEKDISALMIMMPYSGRFMIKHSSSHIGNFTGIAEINFNDEWEVTLASYLTNIQADDEVEVRWVSHLSTLKYISEVILKIPLWIGITNDDDFQILKKHPFIELSVNESWRGYCTKRNFQLSKDGSHFNEEAHESFFKDVINPWIIQNLLVNWQTRLV